MARPLFYPHGARIAVLTQEVVGILDYLAPEGGVRLGQLVVVPLGPRHPSERQAEQRPHDQCRQLEGHDGQTDQKHGKIGGIGGQQFHGLLRHGRSG
ncbi:hypothetical protein IT41_16950 [Paracoccus halophilus]|uniref:Uncharacterized protein n=1 Tax=Paracoccus halophilus TaxID=376733 RepID=A0A099EXB2_9RHOB|nr:hypothetical protein IT41_16950 [Paracoccus halophilus]